MRTRQKPRSYIDDSSVPNHRAIVEQVAHDYPDWFSINSRASCALIQQEVLRRLPPAEAWGFISKQGGENGYTWPCGVRTGVDVIALREPYRQVDIVGAAGANDDPDPSKRQPATVTWSVIDPHEYREHNVWTPLDAVTTYASGAHDCKLGATWFWLMAGFRYWPDQVRRNLDWFATHLPLDYVRTLACVGGNLFLGTDGQYYDPWLHAGAWIVWPNYDELVAKVTDTLFDDYNIQTQWTLIGGLAQIPTKANQDALVDRVCNVLRGREHKVFLIEAANEYRVNGCDMALVQRVAARVRQQLPAVACISPSAPHVGCGPEPELIAEVDAMYLDCPEANAATPHFCRAAFLPPLLGTSAPAFVTSNEPRGPKASTGGDCDDPWQLAQDYQAVVACGYRGYVLHSNWGVYGDHLEEHFVIPGEKGVFVNIYDHRNMDAIAVALRDVREGQAPPATSDGTSPAPLPPTPITSSWQLLAGESLRGDGTLVSANNAYRLIYQLDGNLVLYDSEGAIWQSGTAGASVGALAMQADGNLVLYDADGLPLRASHTDGHPGAMAQLNDDGHVVVYDDPQGPHAGTPLQDITVEFFS